MSVVRAAALGQAAVIGGGVAAWWWRQQQDRALPSDGDVSAPPPSADRVIAAAKDVVRATRSLGMVCCASSTTSLSCPTCRLMDLRFCDDDSMRFHLITKPWTRKAAQLQQPGAGVTITFHDHREGGENGYASLSGYVREVVDSDERNAAWKSSWGFFHERAASASSMWEFIPYRTEVVNHRHRVAPSWRAASVVSRSPSGTALGERPAVEGLWELEARTSPAALASSRSPET